MIMYGRGSENIWDASLRSSLKDGDASYNNVAEAQTPFRVKVKQTQQIDPNDVERKRRFRSEQKSNQFTGSKKQNGTLNTPASILSFSREKSN